MILQPTIFNGCIFTSWEIQGLTLSEEAILSWCFRTVPLSKLLPMIIRSMISSDTCWCTDSWSWTPNCSSTSNSTLLESFARDSAGENPLEDSGVNTAVWRLPCWGFSVESAHRFNAASDGSCCWLTEGCWTKDVLAEFSRLFFSMTFGWKTMVCWAAVSWGCNISAEDAVHFSPVTSLSCATLGTLAFRTEGCPRGWYICWTGWWRILTSPVVCVTTTGTFTL